MNITTNDKPSEGLEDDSGESLSPVESSHSPEPPKPLSEPPVDTKSTKADIEELLSSILLNDPLRILGPDLFELAITKLYRKAMTKDESRTNGMIYPKLGDRNPFFWRDREARASYVYKCIVGLTWPCDYSQAKRQRLAQNFTDGWTSSDLVFLADVPFDELEVYREMLNSD